MLQPSSIVGLSDEIDDHFREAVEVVVQYDHARASLLQRRLSDTQEQHVE